MDVVRQTLAVLLVFALLGLALWKLRLLGNVTAGKAGPAWWNRARRGPRSLETVERLPLTPHHTLHLVRMNGREVLVATHPQGCEILVQSPESSESAQA
jgi:hypothetical protein